MSPFVAGVNGIAAYRCGGAPVLLRKAPISVASLSAGATVAVDPSGKRVFVVGVNGLEVFDVSDPAELKQVAKVNNEVASVSAGGHVAVSNAIYIGGVKRLLAHDLQTLQKLCGMTNEVGSLSGGTAVAAAGNRLCAAGVNGIAVYDTSDPCNIRLLGKVKNECGTLSAGVDIAIDPSGIKLCAAGAVGVAVYDVSLDGAPQLLGKLPNKVATISGGAHVAVFNSRAYVAGTLGIAAYDWAQGAPMEICITGQDVGTQSAGVALAADDTQLIAVGVRGIKVITPDTSKWPSPPPPQVCCCCCM